jgi:D-alanyl-D-alanine carboxypeptidase (penicillin-binding protein 5/6)
MWPDRWRSCCAHLFVCPIDMGFLRHLVAPSRTWIVLALTSVVTMQAWTAWCQPLKVEISSPASCMLDLSNGLVMWEKQAHERRCPASLTKIATALVILEHYKADPKVTIVAQAEALQINTEAERAVARPYGLASDGTSIDLVAGEEMTVEALLEGLLIRSGNDAANVLAMHFGRGSIPRFMDTMNSYLVELGCQETHFANPHGLHVADHLSSAADLARISWRAMQHPLIQTIAAKRQFHRPKTRLKEAQVLPTTNRLLRPGKEFDPRARGLKTGSTQSAGACLAAVADLGDRKIVTIVLGAQGRQRFADTRTLFDAAASEKKALRAWAEMGPIGQTRPVHGGSSRLQPYLKESLSGWVFPSSEEAVRLELRLQEGLRPPVLKGQQVGSLIAFSPRGQELARSPVVAAESIEPTWTYRISQLWKHWGPWGDYAVLASLFLGLVSWLGVLMTPPD